MGSVMIVVMKPGVVGCGPGCIIVVRVGVRPLGREGAVEAFDFPGSAVGLVEFMTASLGRAELEG